MKIHFEKGGVVFEWEQKPMKEGRFRVLCLLAAATIYAGMVGVVTALCGIFGLGVVMLTTFFCVMLAGGM